MAIPILAVLAEGGSLENLTDLARIVSEWKDWAQDAKDVGNQTRVVLGLLGSPITEEDSRQAAQQVHAAVGRSGGNGSLMRTGPVALGCLGDRQEEALVEVAMRVADLTHWESDNGSACALWSLAVRHAILTGELDVANQVRWVPVGQQGRWIKIVAEALEPTTTPKDFSQNNGWVVAAFQGALSAVVRSASLTEALKGAVRGGGDTDTVAAIAGSLAGAIYGESALPQGWIEITHGWPNLSADDLAHCVDAALSHQGWGSAPGEHAREGR